MMTEPILYVISGAGLSAESGVPTFRIVGGVWEQFDKNRVCNFYTWKTYRDEVFAFYAGRRKEASAVQPNAAHVRLAEWQRRWGPERVQFLTQNVETLLEQAGATAVTHLHGDLQHLLCTACSHSWPVSDEDYHERTRCVKCNSLNGVKPGVVLFNEQAPEYLKLDKVYRSIRQEDIFLVVGSSMEVVTPNVMIPKSRVGHARNWQVNPQIAFQHWFGRNIAKTACAGLEELEVELVELMGSAS